MSYNFNPKIDHDFIISMYEDDYLYITEVFTTTLTQLIPDIEEVKKNFKDGNVGNLRKLVHKIKPAYGFVGLLQTEAVCQQFENECLSVSSAAALEVKYSELIEEVEAGAIIIRQEIEKLKDYNSKK